MNPMNPIQMAFFKELEKIILQFLWKCKRQQVSKIILIKNRAGSIMFPDYRLYHNDTVIKIALYKKTDTYIKGTKQRGQK